MAVHFDKQNYPEKNSFMINKLALSDIRSVEFTWKFNAMCKCKV
ncbi:hypothetical protein T05_7739 [Trichinella murrelli]|uniref:Uncharacterized protein n=1 Tax=Trichinella murrelli TaxID=144512 RepID=A0A0V0SXY2_9BILA|nr:hypothetical protein T05_7739 [Trichinella murrelli]